MADTSETITYRTGGGIRVTRMAEAFDAAELDEITQLVEQRPGGVLSSGMEYPGRYSRWHLAYVDPPVQIVARGRRISATALNQRGEVLLPAIETALQRAAGSSLGGAGGAGSGGAGSGGSGASGAGPGGSGPPTSTSPGRTRRHVEVIIPESDEVFTEEQRSRRPTVFSALREIIAAFRPERGDPTRPASTPEAIDAHLGLYGAFGYDLAFQFEPVRQRITRDATSRDLVLHLPDQVWVVDRKRETATRYRYEFEIAAGSPPGPAGAAGPASTVSPAGPASTVGPAGPASTVGLPRLDRATPGHDPAKSGLASAEVAPDAVSNS